MKHGKAFICTLKSRCGLRVKHVTPQRISSRAGKHMGHVGTSLEGGAKCALKHPTTNGFDGPNHPGLRYMRLRRDEPQLRAYSRKSGKYSMVLTVYQFPTGRADRCIT